MLITYIPIVTETGLPYAGNDVVILKYVFGEENIAPDTMNDQGDGTWTYELADMPGDTVQITCQDVEQTCTAKVDIIRFDPPPATLPTPEQTYIDGIRARGIAATDIDDAAVTTVIGEALYEYSRFRPIIGGLTFDTVADKHKYTWAEVGDSAGIDVLECIWHPDGPRGGANEITRTLEGYSIDMEADYHLPSQKLVEDIKKATSLLASAGRAYQNGPAQDINLVPCPRESGIGVYILYTRLHSDLSSIPTTDRDIFLDLVEAMCCERVVKLIARRDMAMTVKTPEYERSVGEQLGYWRKQGKELRASFAAKCQVGASCART